MIQRRREPNKKAAYYRNPVLTHATRQITTRHDQYLQLQNSRQIGSFDAEQEERALLFTQAAQELKRKVKPFLEF